MITCKVCKKEMKRLTIAHIATHGMKTMKEYEEYGEELVEGLEEIATDIKDLTTPEEEKITMSYDERREYLFKDKEKDPDRPLSQFLQEQGVSESELESMIHKYKAGRELNVTEQINKNVNKGKEEAEKYKDKEKVEVHDVNTAESLEKYHRFTCTEVKSKPIKTWVLIKNK